MLCISSFLDAAEHYGGLYQDYTADKQDSLPNHGLFLDRMYDIPSIVRKKHKKTQPLEVVTQRHWRQAPDSETVAIHKADKKKNTDDQASKNEEGTANTDGGDDPKKPEDEAPKREEKPPENVSRWCRGDSVLISVGELTLFNLLAIFILILLTIWHLTLIITSNKNPDGYNTWDQAIPKMTMEEDEEPLIQQEGYSGTEPGKYVMKFLICYMAICQVIVLSFICNELCVPLVDGIDYWEMRALPFLISWVLGFVILLSSFIVRNTHIGKCLFLVKAPLSSCEQVHITDYSKTRNPGEQDILRSMVEWYYNLATFLKLKLNIPDRIFRVTFDKYKNAATYVYVPVLTAGNERYFYYQYVKFTYNPELDRFEDSSRKVTNYLRNTNLTDLLDKGGLTEAESFRRTCEVGKNTIAVQTLSFSTLLYREVSDPVFFLQLYLTLKSVYWKSIITAPIWGFMVVHTILKKVRIINDQQRDLHQLANAASNSMVTVLRENVTKAVPASDLAIGDIVRVESNWEVPSDMVMLRGDVIVDESSITGESVPLRKSKLIVDKYGYSLSIFDPNLSMAGKGKRAAHDKEIVSHLLKAGTRIISVVGNEDITASAVAVVVATGVYTTKGKQMKGVLFPNQFRLKYDTQLPMIFILTSIYALVCSSYQIQFLGWNMTSLFYSLGTLSQVAPVWASTMISIGQSRACERIAESDGICCIAPSRIPIFGKLRVMCFDKTGTLTRNLLVFHGMKLISGKQGAEVTMTPDEVKETINSIQSVATFDSKKDEDEKLKQILALAMATCHSLFPRDGDNEQLGNQVDKSMFDATGCTVEQFIDSDGNTRRYIRSASNRSLIMEVLRTFDFNYQKKLSSIVVSVRTTASDKRVLFAFVKGAYESVDACSTERSSELGDLANREASQGSYVLGMGYKLILTEDNISKRENVESKLRMGGLLIFNNSVRDDSASVISTLQEAKVRPVILTGDNIPASQFVAKAVRMFDESSDAGIYANMVDGKPVWHFPQTPVDEETLYFGTQCDNLAVTGDVFDHLEDDWENILHTYGRFTTNKSANDYLFEQFLLRVRVFARLNPHQKVRVINAFKRLGIITGMCGDGTNDCLALQASHAGISLTNGTASMVAPFTSKNNKLQSVITLIREGRGSLVTSLACFKFMLLFGLMIAFVKVCLFKKCRGVMPEWGYLLLENAILLSLSHTMALSRPIDRLRIRSPTSSLLGPLSLSSVGFMFGTNVIFLLLLFRLFDWLGIKSSLEFNSKANPASWWILSDNFESPTVCLWLCYQVVNAALVFSFGGIFRESVLSNTYFTMTWFSINAILTFLLFTGPSKFTCLFRINCTDKVSRETVFPVLRLLTTSANGNPFYGQEGNNILPTKFKILFLLLNFTNSLVNGLISRYLLGNEFLKALRTFIGHKCSADRIKV